MLIICLTGFPPALQAFIEDADQIKLGVQIGGALRARVDLNPADPLSDSQEMPANCSAISSASNPAVSSS